MLMFIVVLQQPFFIVCTSVVLVYRIVRILCCAACACLISKASFVKVSIIRSLVSVSLSFIFSIFVDVFLRRVNKALHHFSIWNWWLKLWVVSWCRTKDVWRAVMLGNAAAACFAACLTYFTSYVRRLLCKTTLSCYSSNHPATINSSLIFFSWICSGNYFGLHIMSFVK